MRTVWSDSPLQHCGCPLDRRWSGDYATSSAMCSSAQAYTLHQTYRPPTKSAALPPPRSTFWTSPQPVLGSAPGFPSYSRRTKRLLSRKACSWWCCTAPVRTGPPGARASHQQEYLTRQGWDISHSRVWTLVMSLAHGAQTTPTAFVILASFTDTPAACEANTLSSIRSAKLLVFD